MENDLQRELLTQTLRHLCGLEAVVRRYLAYLDKELFLERPEPKFGIEVNRTEWNPTKSPNG